LRAVDYLLFRLKLTSRPTRASHVRTFNSGRSPRETAGRLDTGFEAFFPALSAPGCTTFKFGSASQVSTGTVCVFTLIIRNANALLLPNKHGQCHNSPGAFYMRNPF
jgi:hypothetical protein